MSKVLEGLKPTVVKARNLTYFGRYSQSVFEFNKIITCLETEINKISDKLLIDEWNKLITEMKYEKSLAENMLDILAGNFDSIKNQPSKRTTSNLNIEQPLTEERHRHY